MTLGDTRWARVRELFERAFDERPVDVAAWLDRQGVDDWQVREEVLSLMRHDASAGTFLARPAGDQMPDLLAEGSAFEPGDALGQYMIVREIGRGGMGHVYLADDTRLRRRVALKVLSPEFTTDLRHRERLRREARAAAGLAHPGISTIHALEELDGVLVIVSEFIDGRTLRDEIASVRLRRPEEIMRTASELAAALAHAHAHGVTHRDLKPENVMRTHEGALKILDFGLARLDEGAPEAGAGLTQPGTIIGTPAYMAPEQLNGERGDARSDVFAFGVLMYEYASGMHPFQAPTPLATIGRILESHATPLDNRRTDLPATLVTAIDRCLSKLPADRFASAEEIAVAFERADPGQSTGRMTGWWRRHQLVVMATYFLGCALAWQIKEWQPGVTTALFIAAGIAATVAGILRGHLVFLERMNRSGLAAEHRRATPVTLAMDLLLGLVLLADGVLLASARPLPAVIAMAFGAGIILARLIIEPSTTSASFQQ
jgi:tRNA A-37 threonylcarbamoyl transferase component Bud32